jgi:threonine dehydratase
MLAAERSAEPLPVALSELQRRREASADIVRVTPVMSARSTSARIGGDIRFKAENLQRTGSFKLRGALSKLSTLAESCTEVVAGSAGNHAQALAYAARTRQLACTVYVPVGASLAKIGAVEAFGARVLEGGDSVDSCIAHAREYAAEHGAEFVHPFDDIEVVKGQAGLGLELCEQVPEMAKVVIPIGGGGLASGVAMAIRSLRADVEVVGVQAASCAPLAAMLNGRDPVPPSGPTIADGIAIKRPGELTRPLLERLLDDIVTVEDEQIADAMMILLQRSKLLTEGAGAAATAALISGVTAPAKRGATVAILSGGNVDLGVLSSLITRHETLSDRRLRLYTRVPDRAGGLAAVLVEVAEAGASVREVVHVREGVELDVAQTGVELWLETRGAEHAQQVIAHLESRGHAVRTLDRTQH